ncbi:hypothetical protein BJAS_P4255 [Bathymodiolus japonicus methanotrophic gill symbiont]|uniref:hypothetical protein n=1 Tax=Bathymodiolus japonicus methanotrophic gill symbiont TaxID=113269 RepID=UPI001B6FD462|nr:hypothetical protein [Bathymodiolus japonicus methanotrophic gill symbiont]GFO73444.1 hypothetical protein BJAS_P4255 [Bathymodiolus japonicus methanotrophic gill symbiont]
MSLTRKLVVCLVMIINTGCATFSRGYTPETVTTTSRYTDSDTVPLQDISFSVDLISEIGRFDALSKEDIVEEVKEKLRATGLYKKILYAPFIKKESKHFYFQIIISGTKEEEGFFLGYLSGLTVMSIPVISDYYSDMSVFIIEKNNEVFSASASEKIIKIIWLPLIILSPLFNDYAIANKVLEKQVDYLIREISARPTGV